MGFLDKSNLKHGRMVVEKHPLFSNGDVPLSVRQMYLQGCILAVLEREDGNLPPSDKAEIRKLGTALQIADQDIAEAISTMSNMKTAEDQEEFLREFFLVLSGEEYPPFFMKDFEALLKGNAELSDEASQTLDYFGQGLTGSQNWRECSTCRQVEETRGELPDIQKVTNWEGAAKAYLAAAEAGNAHAQGCLAFCYAKTRSGNGGGNDEKMFELAKKSATQGDPVGQKVLGFCFREGIGTERDFVEGVKWYRKAAEQGDAGAQAYLGLCYAQGQGLTENITEAIKWWRKAAKQGNADAQCNLGDCYLNGQGVQQNSGEAIRWYRMAAEQGSSKAQFNLGCCYVDGAGVQVNEGEGIRWLQQVVESGGELADEAQEIISKLQSETAFQKWDRNISNKIDDFFDNLFG